MSDLVSSMVIERMLVQEIVPADYNPRKALKPGVDEYEKLKASIETFGLVEPLIWNKRTGTLVGGHQRLTVLMDMGVREVDVSVVDLDLEHEKALNVALNKIEGGWDGERLAELLSSLDANLQELAGFGEAEIDELLGQKKMGESGGAMPETTATTKPGDLWLLGPHRLYCGDACKADDMSVLMNEKSAQLVVTDPPYNVNYQDKINTDAGRRGFVFKSKSRTDSQVSNDVLPQEEFNSFLYQAFSVMRSSLQPGGVAYVFHADSMGLAFRQAFSKAGFYSSQCLIWVKSPLMLSRSDYHWKHEPILYGWRDDGPHKWYGRRKQSTVVEDGACVAVQQTEDGAVFSFSDGFNSFVMRARDYEIIDDGHDDTMSVFYYKMPARNDLHPTMKPVGLLEKLIRNSSKRGDIVLDSFGGSGSTLIASERQGRICYTMELDPRYCDVIVKRYVDETSNSDVWLIRDGVKTPYCEAVPQDV